MFLRLVSPGLVSRVGELAAYRVGLLEDVGDRGHVALVVGASPSAGAAVDGDDDHHDDDDDRSEDDEQAE